MLSRAPDGVWELRIPYRALSWIGLGLAAILLITVSWPYWTKPKATSVPVSPTTSDWRVGQVVRLTDDAVLGVDHFALTQNDLAVGAQNWEHIYTLSAEGTIFTVFKSAPAKVLKVDKDTLFVQVTVDGDVHKGWVKLRQVRKE